MPNKPQKTPGVSWRCTHCWKTAQKNSKFCAECGASWTTSADTTYYPPSSETSSWEQWPDPAWDRQNATSWQTDTWQRPKSPRRRPSRSRNPTQDGADKGQAASYYNKGQKGAGKKGKAGRGKGKNQVGKNVDNEILQGKGPPAAMPTWKSPIPDPAQYVPPAIPAPPPISPAEAKLKELTAALRKTPDNLTPEVQALVKDVAMSAGQTETTKAVQAVEELGVAKERLSAVKWARYQNHGAWKNFLQEAMEQMTVFANAFQEQEAVLGEAVQKARAAVLAAKEKSDAAKDGIQEISDGEEMDSADPPQALQEGLQNMTQVLTKMHSEAMTLHDLERFHRTTA